MKRREFALSALGVAGGLAVSGPAQAQARSAMKALTVGMVLEPPGLDPTAGAASAIAEIVLYNVFETLTRILPSGEVGPLLAQRWEISEDQLSYRFTLQPGVKFQNGKPCDSAAVRFSFERAAAKDSTNKDRATFATIAAIDTPDAQTVVIRLRSPLPDFLFMLGLPTAVIVEPDSVATNATQPVGTGPYQLQRWQRGSALTLVASKSYREPERVKIPRVSFRFISEPAAQIAALLAGDVDYFPRVSERGIARFRSNPAFQVVVSGSRAKTLVAINHRRKPLDDVRVRRAIAAAIDRKAVLAAAQQGYGTPIGSHYVPTAPGYVDMTAVNPYDPDKARALLKEAGVKLPLRLTLTLPPPPYARQGAEVVMAQLAKVGITCTAQNVEWAQWLAGTHRNHDYDLSIVSHVEPLDLGNFARHDYYWGYRSEQYNALYQQMLHATDPEQRLKYLAQIQQLLADDSVLAWLYQPNWVSVARKQLRGVPDNMPILCNDLLALSWQ